MDFLGYPVNLAMYLVMLAYIIVERNRNQRALKSYDTLHKELKAEIDKLSSEVLKLKYEMRNSATD